MESEIREKVNIKNVIINVIWNLVLYASLKFNLIICVFLIKSVEIDFVINWLVWLFRGLIGYKYKWYQLNAEVNNLCLV